MVPYLCFEIPLNAWFGAPDKIRATYANFVITDYKGLDGDPLIALGCPVTYNDYINDTNLLVFYSNRPPTYFNLDGTQLKKDFNLAEYPNIAWVVKKTSFI